MLSSILSLELLSNVQIFNGYGQDGRRFVQNGMPLEYRTEGPASTAFMSPPCHFYAKQLDPQTRS